MRIKYPKEITDIRDAIPEKYFTHPENAPKEYQALFELWKKKSLEYDLETRKILFGF
ncbi:MAG: hypothetical protein Q4C56_06895 [Peptococcaceae bacterium]|nr:hypothetical protein [Peptococcaceae bacterium]